MNCEIDIEYFEKTAKDGFVLTFRFSFSDTFILKFEWQSTDWPSDKKLLKKLVDGKDVMLNGICLCDGRIHFDTWTKHGFDYTSSIMELRVPYETIKEQLVSMYNNLTSSN